MLNVLLSIVALGFVVFLSFIVGAFKEDLVGASAGVVVFSLVLNLLLFLTILLGCFGFFNRDFTSLLLQVFFLFFILGFQIIGAVFFSVTAEVIKPSGPGFVTVVQEIEQNFEAQVFNDCCLIFLNNNAVAPVDVSKGASFGDIVNDELCKDLIEEEQDSFVGNTLATSCGGVGVFDFNVFQNDFDIFTRDLFKPIAALLWLQSGLTILVILFTFYQLCYVSRSEGDEFKETERTESQQDIPMPPPNNYIIMPKSSQAPLTVPATFRFTQNQKQAVGDFFGRISANVNKFRQPSMKPPPMPQNAVANNPVGGTPFKSSFSSPPVPPVPPTPPSTPFKTSFASPPVPPTPPVAPFGNKNPFGGTPAALSSGGSNFPPGFNAPFTPAPEFRSAEPSMAPPPRFPGVQNAFNRVSVGLKQAFFRQPNENPYFSTTSDDADENGYKGPPNAPNKPSPPTLPSMSRKPNNFKNLFTRFSAKVPPSLPSFSAKPNRGNTNPNVLANLEDEI